MMKKQLLMITLCAALIAVPVHAHSNSNSFPDENKHHALLRLEDIGPGSWYATPDGLGKLRTVLHYLEDQHIPFHLAVIPRSKSIQANGQWYEKGIDDAHPDEQTKAFIRVLQEAQAKGGVLGMHGYTHQYGTAKRGDDNQDSGTGFEFDVPGAPETDSLPYAENKINKSLAAFAKVGFQPGFWESPHYHDTRAQEEVFRSYIGLLYQPDFRSLRSLKDINMYDSENTTGRTTLGSAYIPAPLKYIHNASSVDQILQQLPTYRGLAAMYYHPFLEFPDLEPVKDASGHTVIQDGLPLYQYKKGSQSNLHRLVAGFAQQDFTFVSIYDVVPFSPAHRVNLPPDTTATDLMLGDVTGSGHADVVLRTQGHFDVIPGHYDWPRNRAQQPAQEWLHPTLAADDTATLADINGDHREDLLLYNKKTGGLRAFPSTGTQFAAEPIESSLLSGADQVLPTRADSDSQTDLLLRKGQEVFLSQNSGGHLTAPQKVLALPAGATLLTGDITGDQRDDLVFYSQQDRSLHIYRNLGAGRYEPLRTVRVPSVQAGDQFVISDTNGDRHADVTIYDPQNGVWQVWQGESDGTLHPIDNSFGPWAHGDRVALTADFDGNGKQDMAAYDPTAHVLDLALSFRK